VERQQVHHELLEPLDALATLRVAVQRIAAFDAPGLALGPVAPHRRPRRSCMRREGRCELSRFRLDLPRLLFGCGESGGSATAKAARARTPVRDKRRLMIV
jgi:hypothetical protein